MKAFLLAAGHGSRLRPLTDRTPKCLLPIRGEPMLDIWLRICKKAGIDQVLINVHAHAAQVREYLGAHPFGGFVTVHEEAQLLGSAGTLRENRGWIGNDQLFWIFYADVLTNVDLHRFALFQQANPSISTIGVTRVLTPSRCGIITCTEDGLVRTFVEKPKNPLGDLAFSGIALVENSLLSHIPVSGAADIGFHVMPNLVRRMKAYEIQEFLMDIGTLENYRSAQESWPGL